jgi:biopolymer transport protein ExbD
MAGAQDSENPVGINVVPMVDVIFCLCVFFMCSMNWKEPEGNLDAWLPKDRDGRGDAVQIDEIRVALFWDAGNHRTVRQLGRTVVHDDNELRALLADAHADCVRIGHPEVPCIVDAAEQVPWQDVVGVIDLARSEGVDRILFAAGRDYEALPPKK